MQLVLGRKLVVDVTVAHTHTCTHAQVERNKRPADSTASSSVNPASVSKGTDSSPTKSSANGANGATRGDSDDSDEDF